MTTKHTPGPWFFAKEGSTTSKVYVVGRSDAVVCRTLADNPNSGADARLIAAAPDLAEALRQIAHDAEPQASGGGVACSKCGNRTADLTVIHVHEVARAALEKAGL